MSSAAAASLTFASQQVAIYTGFLLFTVGLIGEPLVLLVFLSLKTFRQSSCAFYLTIMSIVNFFYLFIGLLTYIMINGFGIDWTILSLFYCKFRSFYVQVLSLISLTCLCFATIDQFLATCSNPRWHRWNNIRIARYMIAGTVIVWFLYGVPLLMYYNHTISPVAGKHTCSITNVIFQKYFTVFHIPVLVSSLPVIIMSVFGVLAYRNVRQIARRTVPFVRRELDKQLTMMVLVEVFCDVLTVLPLIIQNIYSSMIGTPSNSFILAQVNFIRNLTLLFYYLHFVSAFYIYIIVSKRFRQQLIHVLFTIHLNRWRLPRPNNNQIQPES